MQVFEQIRYGRPPQGIHSIRCNFRQRNQHKSAFPQPWMRNLKSGFVNHTIAEEQQVQVQCTRAVAHPAPPVAPKRPLNAQ